MDDKLSEKITECTRFLQELSRDSGFLLNFTQEQRIALIAAAGRLSRPNKNEIRKRKNEIRIKNRRLKAADERKVRASAGIRVARGSAVFTAPARLEGSAVDRSGPDLRSPGSCYVCKSAYTKQHFFYDSMCPTCADFNYKKRFQTAPLDGKVVLITGSRLKIGYQAALMLLRAGARVIATTRFPVDAALRYSKESDFNNWAGRLHVYGLDLRHTPSVDLFCRHIEGEYDRLDILINNAAQTVRRPPGFYAHLMPNETRDPESLPSEVRALLAGYESCKRKFEADGSRGAPMLQGDIVSWSGKEPGIGLRAPALLSQIPYSYDHSLDPGSVFPEGQLDADLQQVDLRETNSWRLRIGEIPVSEMLEIQLVNAIAPFVLCNRLVPMMKRDYTGQKHIVNVSAMEGKFYRFKKASRHPHTNMAKAALNMMTHTSASELALHGIFMNAVDTGWVTDEDPAKLAELKRQRHDFQPPLDIVDGAARVCDPFFDGILTGKHWCGKFLKDYFPIDW